MAKRSGDQLGQFVGGSLKTKGIKKINYSSLDRVTGSASGQKTGGAVSALQKQTVPQPQTVQPKGHEYGTAGRTVKQKPAVPYTAKQEERKVAAVPTYITGLQTTETPRGTAASGTYNKEVSATLSEPVRRAVKMGLEPWTDRERKERAWRSGRAAPRTRERYGPKLSAGMQTPAETGRGDFHRYARRPEVWELRDPAQVRYELEGLEEQYRVLYQDALDTLDRAEWSEDRDGTMVEAARKYKDAFALSPQISDLKKELKEIEEAQRRYLMEAEGYRDATPWDLTVGSLKQGYYNSRYGQESYKAMLGQENEKERYQELLEGDEYKFVPSNWVERGLSGGLSMVGQQARQLTDPRTLGVAMTAAGTAAWLGNAGPQALAPEEVVTVPMATGAALKAGSALVNYEIEAGLAYNELLQNGVSEETARTIAQGVGGVNAALELVQLDELFKSFQILQKSGASQSLLQKIGGEVLRRAGSVGSETLQEMAQEGVAIAGVQAGSKLDKGEWAYSGEEVLDRIGQTGISSALSFGMLNVPGAVYSGGRLAQTGMNNWVSDQTADILLRDPQFLDYLDRKVGLKLTKDMSPEEKRNAVKDSVADMLQGKKDTSTGTAKDVIVRSSGISALDGQESLAKTLASNIDKISDMEVVSYLTGTEMNDRNQKASEQIRALFAKIGTVIRKGFGEVSFNEYGVGGILNHRPLNRAKMVSLVAVPEVIRNGRIISDVENWKGRGYRSVVFAAPVAIGESIVYVAAVVNQNPNGKFYLNECVDSEGNYIRIEATSPTTQRAELP